MMEGQIQMEDSRTSRKIDMVNEGEKMTDNKYI